MFPITVNELILIMASCIMLLGVASVGAGIVILVTKVAGKDVQIIANQTAKLAQKGLAEEISGLVGNASSLLEAMNQMVRTSTGIGVFLVVVGFLLLLTAFYMAKQVAF
ncbi:MAG TPA: hypothetical protein VIO61_12055 [Anaerolineaceae bacterium]